MATYHPTADDLASASPEQYATWVHLNANIAYVHTAWASLELMLAWLLAAVLKIKIAQAQIVLATLSSNRTKREVIQNCAMISLQSEARRKDIGRLLRRISKVASKRNFLAHGAAGYHQKYPDGIAVTGTSVDLNPALSHYIVFGIPDLEEIRRTIDLISGDVLRLLPVIDKARRRALPETPQTAPDQDAAFFDNPRQPPPETPSVQPESSRQSPRPKKLSPAQKRALRERDGAS